MYMILRDLATEKAKENNFLTVGSKPDEEQSFGVARCVAVHSDSNRLIKYASPSLHSLLCFQSPLPICSGHRVLKMLSMSNVTSAQSNFTKTEKKSFGGLTLLRYLRLNRDTDIDNSTWFIKLISKMKFLQILDLRYIKPCGMSCYHDSLWDHQHTLFGIKKIERHGGLKHYHIYQIGVH
jgi:hypothetical protein